MIYGIAILGVLLAISTAGNAWQFKHGEALLEAKATATQLNADTKRAAETCSAGVDKLTKAGTTRQRILDAALKSIQPAVERGQRETMEALKARPADPKDLCGSLEQALNQRIQAEKKAAGTP